ncbi:MAG: 4-hydroxythreonine-4-phosphate dehydrogenase PdxA [Verrucomicrobiales bacterium]|nr:4-hydroxythreonine-4-phosphate dehydrogenase PdxA [Verrucomicrobiales bacterium]
MTASSGAGDRTPNRRPSARIGIALGDVTGIGPEITLKALRTLVAGPGPEFLILGDRAWLRRANEPIGLPLADRGQGGRVEIWQPQAESLPTGLSSGAPEAARAAVEWLRHGAQGCLDGELAALVTAPVSKLAIIRAGIPFVGQTELLARIAQTERAGMMLLAPDERDRWLRVMLVTTHLPLRDVPDAITAERVRLACELGHRACVELGLARARLGVAGLNPHAGEGGALGREEIDTIGPALESARSSGLDVVGPIPADTLFHQALRGDFDVVVAMYHDQGLGPLKMIGFERGVNWTVGLPFVRTSPDHGTAYDLAGRNQADPSSMLAALRLAIRLSKPCPS